MAKQRGVGHRPNQALPLLLYGATMLKPGHGFQTSFAGNLLVVVGGRAKSSAEVIDLSGQGRQCHVADLPENSSVYLSRFMGKMAFCSYGLYNM